MLYVIVFAFGVIVGMILFCVIEIAEDIEQENP